MADITPDVMKRFLSGFQAGSGAAETSGRLGLAASGQAMDFVQSQQKLEMQRQAQQSDIAMNNARINAQRESQSAQTALANQRVQMDQQQAAMQYKLQEQKMNLDRVAFVENLKAQKLIAEQNMLKYQNNLENIKEQNTLAREELSLKKQGLEQQRIERQSDLDNKKQHNQMQVELRNRAILENQFKQTMAIAADPLKGSQFRTADGQIDQQKVYDFAAANARRIVDPSGMSKPQLPTQEELAEEKKIDTTGNSQQSEQGIKPSGNIISDAILADKLTKAKEGKKPGDIIVVDGKKYRVK